MPSSTIHNPGENIQGFRIVLVQLVGHLINKGKDVCRCSRLPQASHQEMVAHSFSAEVVEAAGQNIQFHFLHNGPAQIAERCLQRYSHKRHCHAFEPLIAVPAQPAWALMFEPDEPKARS